MIMKQPASFHHQGAVISKGGGISKGGPATKLMAIQRQSAIIAINQQQGWSCTQTQESAWNTGNIFPTLQQKQH
jgi:hypothetical protein